MQFEIPIQLSVVRSKRDTFGLSCNFESPENRELANRLKLYPGEFIGGQATRFTLLYIANEDHTSTMTNGTIEFNMVSEPSRVIFFSNIPEMTHRFIAHFSNSDTPNVSFTSAVVTFELNQRLVDELDRMNIHTDAVYHAVAEFERHINDVYTATFTNLNVCPAFK